MKFYSEVTKEIYDTAEACKEAEAEAKRKADEAAQIERARQAKFDKARGLFIKARELRAEFCHALSELCEEYSQVEFDAVDDKGCKVIISAYRGVTGITFAKISAVSGKGDVKGWVTLL